MKQISQTKKIDIVPSKLEHLFGNFGIDTITSLINEGLFLSFNETFIHQLELQIEFLKEPKPFMAPIFIAFGKRVIDPRNPEHLLYRLRGSNYFYHEGQLVSCSDNGYFPNEPMQVDFAIFFSKIEFHFNAKCFERINDYKMTA